MNLDSDNIDYQLLASSIKERISAMGITQREFAERLGMTPAAVSILINGQRRMSPERYKIILAYLEMDEKEIPQKLTERKVLKSKGDKIFISYNHKDQPFLERLMVHLKPLEKQGLIDTWVDTKLLAGDKWKAEIETALKNAKVGILLISADFLASDFIIDNELPPMLQSAEEKGTLIIPVILKPCRYLRDKNLREFQAINSPEEPLSFLNENERELIYDTIALRIEDSFKNNG